MRGGIGNMMKKAQQMQADMQKQQEKLAGEKTHGESGGGLIKITMNGRHEVNHIEIDDSVMDDKEMLEDLIAAAVNDASHKVANKMQDSMKDMTSGLGLPAGFKMPF